MSRISSGRTLLAVICAAWLGGCFVSEAPLIPEGEAVLLGDSNITLCIDAPDDCFEMEISRDGYKTLPVGHQDTPAQIRFSPLLQINEQQIFVVEALDLEDQTYTFVVARQRTPDTQSAGNVQLALVSCGDLNEVQRTTFIAAGGHIRDGWGVECTPPDLDTLNTALISVYHDQLADEAWWAAGGTS